MPVLAFTLAACGSEAPFASFEAPIITQEAPLQIQRGAGPPDADPDACYARTSIPAVIETVTEQVRVSPPRTQDAEAGDAPAVFVTESRQRIVEERRDIWFETPCAAIDSPDFIASLQRALAARGLYRGQITGRLDARTQRAIRAYQAPQGLDSGVLSRAAARQLGLVLWDPDAARRPG